MADMSMVTAHTALNPDPMVNRGRKLYQQELALRTHSARALEIIQSVDPAKKKLTSVEGQRIVAVLDEVIRRIELITLIPFVTKSLSRYAVVLGSELFAMLEEHKRLEEEYERLTGHSESRPMLVRRGTSLLLQKESSVAIIPLSQAAAERKKDLAAMLRNSVRSILRQFKWNPSAAVAIQAEHHERPVECYRLIVVLKELKEYGKLKLATSKKEEETLSATLAELIHRENKTMGEIRELRKEFATAVQKKEVEVNEKKSIARGLESELEMVNKTRLDTKSRVLADALRQTTNDAKLHQDAKKTLEETIGQLRKKLNDNLTAHRESELQLRKRKFKVENELENWIREYDNDMGERQEEMEEVQKVYDTQKSQLEELEERFKTLEEEYNQVMENRRIAKEKREQAELQLRAMVKAATMLQALWRSFKCRKMLKQKQKKGKKGKKSGKKGGKKGGKKSAKK